MAEGARLEIVCRGNSTEGSNPSLSAKTRVMERCRSGRTGRSRKPLTVQAVRGFESHPLRQSAEVVLDVEESVI